jgi:diketogulonate reductase-like aldo/keto reductase
MNPTRRSFLGQLAGLGALLSRADRLHAQEGLPTRTIPVSGETLPVVGLGSTKAVLEIQTEGPGPLDSVIRTLVSRGGRAVDTSPRSEEIDLEFGRILRQPDLRDRLFVATKINTDDEEEGIAQMRHNQRLLAGGPVDLVQIESLRGIDRHWPNAQGWKESGEARYIGVTVSSNDAHDAVESFLRSHELDFVHVNFSVVETGAEDRILPLARDRGVAVLVNRPFMNGAYFGLVEGRELPSWAGEFGCETWAQFSLKYVLSDPAVTCVLTETTNPDHMDENVDAAFGRLPDQTERARMRELAGTFS